MKKVVEGALIFCLFIIFFVAHASTGLAQSKAPQTQAQMIIDAIRITEPLSFCNEPVPLTNPDVRERLERELLISLDNSDDIILWIKRANRYFPDIEKELKEQSMPDDLKYITIAESSLRPMVFSNKGAVGYWQFIESTGGKYGLDITSDIDERRSFSKSTRAAIKYLKDLYSMLNSWTLAAAAYNMGEDGLKGEMMAQKVNDYYRLYLNQETQRYVFRILAAKIILSNPARFGYVLGKNDLYQPPLYDIVEITAGQPVPLHIIAEAAKTHFKVIKDLNPDIRLYHLPAGTRQVHIPAGTANEFPARYESLIKEWNSRKNEYAYTVKKGDSLYGIAARFGVPVKALMIWNKLWNGKKIAPGDKIYIFSDNFKTVNKTIKTEKPDKKHKTDNADAAAPPEESPE